MLVVVKDTAEGARDAAEELKRRKSINRQGSCRTAALDPRERQKISRRRAERLS